MSEVNAKGSSLLLVDDEELNLDMLSRRLERSGFVVKVASNGRDALRMVHEHPFDLVLLDQMMPGMSGADVLRAIRAEESGEVLPVIMVTAVAESDRVVEALEMGANDYITKPIDFKVALARIQSQLARKRGERALRQSEERYALAARASRDGLWDWNLITGSVYYSPRWREMLGLSPDDVADTPDAWFSRIVAADAAAIARLVEEYLKGSGEVLQCAYRVRHTDGTVRWMSCRGIATRNAAGEAVRVAGSQSDVTEEKTRDALTGLPNRLRLIGQLEWILERQPARQLDRQTDAGPSGDKDQEGIRPAPNAYAVLFLDLDGFKTINDSLGHVAGDYLLKGIAARLRRSARASVFATGAARPPLVARMGGDEFAVLIECGADQAAVLKFATELQDVMKEPFDLEGQSVRCAFSIGIALANPSHPAAEEVLREADMAMYVAKFQRRGEIAVFDPTMRSASIERIELENDIRTAVEDSALVLVYQPKVDLASGLTYGVEALVRWNHPKRGLLQPGLFIPIAEETGAIVQIGSWVLREACRQVGVWQKQFPSVIPLELSVNLSPREFKEKDLVSKVRQIIEETGFPASSLHLEVTENVLFEDITAASETLYALKALGLRLDIDDFGSGYSSLKYLRELPFDSLKIDRYFTAGLNPGQPASGKLIQAILTMGMNLGLQVVAEGIETEPHSATLQKLGCRFGQGFYFSRPLNGESLEKLLDRERGPGSVVHAAPSSEVDALVHVVADAAAVVAAPVPF